MRSNLVVRYQRRLRESANHRDLLSLQYEYSLDTWLLLLTHQINGVGPGKIGQAHETEKLQTCLTHVSPPLHGGRLSDSGIAGRAKVEYPET